MDNWICQCCHLCLDKCNYCQSWEKVWPWDLSTEAEVTDVTSSLRQRWLMSYHHCMRQTWLMSLHHWGRGNWCHFITDAEVTDVTSSLWQRWLMSLHHWGRCDWCHFTSFTKNKFIGTANSEMALWPVVLDWAGPWARVSRSQFSWTSGPHIDNSFTIISCKKKGLDQLPCQNYIPV